MKKQIGIVILTAAALLGACGGQKAETAAETTAAAAAVTAAESETAMAEESTAESAAENAPGASGEETTDASEAESGTTDETASEAESDTAKKTAASTETSAAEEDTSASAETVSQPESQASAETTASAETAAQPESGDAADTPAAAAVSPQSVYEAVSAQVSLPAMFLADDGFISNYYGVDLADLNSYVFASAEEATLADTVILMETKGGDAKERITAALSTVLEQKAAEMQNYLPEQYEIVAKSAVRTEGDWVYLVISAQADAIEAVIREKLN